VEVEVEEEEDDSEKDIQGLLFVANAVQLLCSRIKRGGGTGDKPLYAIKRLVALLARPHFSLSLSQVHTTVNWV
jgi:hypothetical protein